MATISSTLESAAFYGATGVLVFAPLAFGSVHVWAYTLVQTAILVSLGLLAASRLLSRDPGVAGWIGSPLTVPAILIAVLVGIQLVPVPLKWLSWISPEAASDQASLREIVLAAGREIPAAASAAYQRNASAVKATQLLSVFCMWLLVVHTARSRKRINLLATVLALVGVFEALYAVWQAFCPEPTVWWWRARTAPYASGTFVGSNHFATYMILAMPLTLGFAMAQRGRNRGFVQGLGGRRAALQRVLAHFSPEAATPCKVLLYFAALIIGLGVLLSGSRGGILSMAFGLTLAGGMLLLRREFRWHGIITLFFCVGVLICGLTVGIDPTLNKFETAETGFDYRWRRSLSMVPMMADYPLTGVGLGSWRHIYGRYVPQGIGYYNAGHAHNDWFEAGTELGVIGLAVLAAGYGLYWCFLVRTWRRRRNPHAVGIGAGAIAGMVAVALHSFFEFSLHIPANPIALAAVAGLGYAAVHRRGQGPSERFTYPVRRLPGAPSARAAAAAVTLLVLGSAFCVAWRHNLAEMHCPTEWNSTLNLNWDPPLASVRQAIAIDPAQAAYHFKAADYFMSRGSEVGFDRSVLNERAIQSLEAAVMLNPGEARYWFHLGKRYSFRDTDPVAYLNRWLPLADRCFEMAVRCGGMDAEILFDVAWYWVWRASLPPPHSEKTPTDGATTSQGEAIDRFQSLFARSLELRSGRWKKAVDRIWEYFPDDGIVLDSVPPGDLEFERRVLRYLVSKKNQARSN